MKTCNIDIGGFYVVFGEMYCSHHRCASAGKESEACPDEENWRGDVDRRQSVAANALAHKNTVGNIQCRSKQQSQKRRHKQFEKQRRNVRLLKIYRISLHGREKFVQRYEDFAGLRKINCFIFGVC